MSGKDIPFHRYVGADDDPPDAICAACGVRKDRAIHDEETADRHGGFQPVEPGLELPRPDG
jgi:hypothetical protein